MAFNMQSLSFGSKPKSKDVAKDRLKLVLMHDRGILSPDLLEKLRADLLSVFSKYVEIDMHAVDIEIIRVNPSALDEVSTSSLIANVPIKGIKTPIRG